MHRLNKYIIIFVILISSLQLYAANDDYYLKINKSFEVFGAVFRDIINNYVVEVDPEDLMNQGINGMLENLDPYTVYMDANETDDIDLITTGSYVGIGISVGIRDSMLTIVGLHDGFSAQKNGLRIGDRIYKIDSTILINETSDELRKYTRGKAGSKLTMWVIRDGIDDTLNYTITREEIIVKNVPYYGIVGDSLGYIKLDRFSRLSAEEIRMAIYDLKRRCPLKGIILDLRDNPGGLLEAAVAVCEIFLPENSPIVTTRGRQADDEHVYKSILKPVEPDLPLAILINGFSASASEIVAGAIQDLDRGIIIGDRSYGKGLVQSVFDMPYKADLKMTTAKYFTPSGRCIQRLNYYDKGRNKTGLNIHRDSIFYTVNNRPVMESKGILPDSVVKLPVYSDYVLDLFKNDLFFNFVNTYTSTMSSYPDSSAVSQEVIDKFNDYVISTGYIFKTPLDNNLDNLLNLVSTEKLPDKTLKEINNLSIKIKNQEKNPLAVNTEIIENILSMEIYSRFHSDKLIIERKLKNDPYVTTAITLMKPTKYNSILTFAIKKGAGEN